jgi:hypothetical protein
MDERTDMTNSLFLQFCERAQKRTFRHESVVKQRPFAPFQTA